MVAQSNGVALYVSTHSGQRAGGNHHSLDLQRGVFTLTLTLATWDV